MQPYLFPYVGYFQLMNAVDRWIAFDEIQFIDKGWINRNRILHPDPVKEWQFLTVPLSKRGQFDKICNISIKEEIDWRSQIFGKLTMYKKKAPHYNETIDFIHDCFDTKETNLALFVIDILRKTANYIGIETQIEVQSKINLDLGNIEHPGQWALRICEKLGASEYLNPSGGVEIFKQHEFNNAGIKLSFWESKLLPYYQGRDGFISGLSVIDLLMWNSVHEIKKNLL